MNPESGANRWWESYLVRYLMPSIAGVAIVNALCTQAGPDFRALLLLPPPNHALDAASLTLVFLYGNLFCYVASYPILGFHVTRAIDFADGRWLAIPHLDGYLTTLAIAILTLILALFAPEQFRAWGTFALAGLFGAVQLGRLYAGLTRRVPVAGLKGTVSPLFGFAYALARRRGVPEEIKTTTSSASTTQDTNQSLDIDDNEEIKTRRHIQWRPEFIATYRHLREHGNSAFIFVLELVLAALVYCIVVDSGHSAGQKLGLVGGLFAVWALPSVFVHLVGQHLERRFSQYDNRIERASAASTSI